MRHGYRCSIGGVEQRRERERNSFFWLSMANWVGAKKAAEFSFDAS